MRHGYGSSSFQPIASPFSVEKKKGGGGFENLRANSTLCNFPKRARDNKWGFNHLIFVCILKSPYAHSFLRHLTKPFVYDHYN